MLEIGEIFRQAGDLYRQRHGERMLPSHKRVMRDIESCRTPALGGQLWRCDQCRGESYSYHSCQNRHCPKCHGKQTRRWTETWRARLLPCPFFLLTFTLPAQLRTLARTHQKTVYSILIKSAAESLARMTADPRYLGATPGMIAVLHTWTRDMRYHPHVHILATGGGVSEDGSGWKKVRNGGFLVPTRALSVIFRAKIRDALERAEIGHDLPPKTWRRKWVVHCQSAGNGHKVIDYIGRYLHRIAITNSRLESFDGQIVTLRHRDRASGRIVRTPLDAEHFIARFLQHVLPRAFKKIRYYGLFSPRRRATLTAMRELLEHHPATPETIDASSRHDSLDTVGENAIGFPCPHCGIGTLVLVAEILRPRRFEIMRRGPPA